MERKNLDAIVLNSLRDKGAGFGVDTNRVTIIRADGNSLELPLLSKAYRSECAKKTEFERTQLVKEKTGVCIQGLEAVNPVNGKKIPVYIADYVMMGYGTGAIMAVPAHDQRDYDFAKKFGIAIIEVIKGGDIEKEAYTGDGEMVNSDFLNGYTNKKDSIERMLTICTSQRTTRSTVRRFVKNSTVRFP